jgi:hypothetical protein
MNDRDPLEESLLAAARRAHEPSAEDAARVLRATRLAIGVCAPTSTEVADATSGALGAGKGLVGSALAAKLVASALAIASVSGGIGYQLGMRAAEPRTPIAAPAPIATASARLPAAQPSAMQAPSAARAPAAVQPQPREHDEDKPQGLDAAPRARASQPRGPHLEPPTREIVQVGAPLEEASLPLGSLDAEVRALERVQRALRDRVPAEALALLEQLDRDVPQGRLKEERSAAGALARCELGQGEPLAHALEFSQRFPASVYFARVRKTCMDAAKRGGEPQ